MQPVKKSIPPVTSEPEAIDVARVSQAPLQTAPYEHIVISGFIRDAWKERIYNDYPEIKTAGSLPLNTTTYGPNFQRLIDEMNSDEFRAAVEKKFNVALKGKPTMFTVRGNCRMKDGKVHTDSESKIITVLLYMNQPWQNQGGRLRLLKSNNLEDIATEISPDIGTLLIFKRSNSSWHGHLPFEGERKVIQMNWVTEQKYVDREQKRHLWSFIAKKLGIYS
jgi:SM-20-related protein